MIVKIDETKCVGCGRCTEICSESFNLSSEGKAHFIKPTECVLKALDECPVGAIFVDE